MLDRSRVLASLLVTTFACSPSGGSAPAGSGTAAGPGASSSPIAAATATATAIATSSAAAPSSAASAASSPGGTASAPAAEDAPEGMVLVPAGHFKMGGQSEENTPVHEVFVASFFMDKTEVTVDAYTPCVKSGTCKPMGSDNPFCNSKFTDRGKHPANCVDWKDADAFCKSVGKRLPTEREWEYAARGGSEQHLYSWGDAEPSTSNCCYMHMGGTCEVGAYAKGAFGLLDMTGNVWEWTSSWFAPYPDEAAEGRFKVYRGGSWSRRFPKWMHNDLRNRYQLHEHSASLGIRCAKTLLPLTCPEGSEARGEACVKTGTAAPVASSSAAPHPFGGGTAAPAASSTAIASAAPRPEDETPVRGRAARFDEDCQKHYPGLPVAYNWSGGTFQAREPLIRGAGCKKRDVGKGWSSACCPN